MALARTVFAGTQTQIRTHLPPVFEPCPVSHFPCENLFGQFAQAFRDGLRALRFNLGRLDSHLFVQRQRRTPQGRQQLDQPRRHGQLRPVPRSIPFARQPIAVLQSQPASPLHNHFQVPPQTLPQPAFAAPPFLGLGWHTHPGQGMRIARHQPVQRVQHRPCIGPVGLDSLMLVVPVSRPDDVVDRAQGRELPVQNVAEGSGFVARNDLPALRDLLFHPNQKILRCKTLGRFGRLAIVLHGHHVRLQVHIQRQFQCARLSEVIYRLHFGNRRSRDNFVMHMGREFIRALPRPLSALMFSNKSPEPTAVYI